MAVQRADFFSTMMTASRTKWGADSVYPASEHYKTHYGIVLPSLAFRYLMTSNVFMLERITEFYGPRGSGKSSLCYEIARLFIEQGGLATVIETENKTSYGLMRGIIGEKNLEVVQFFRSKSIERAQDELSFSLDQYAKGCPDRNIPYFIMWDSLVGSKADETIASVAEDGHAKRNYAIEAALISTYFGTLPDRLIGLPVSFAVTSHEKIKMGDTGGGAGGAGAGDEMSAGGKKPVGGDAPGFYSTYQLRVVRVKDVVQTEANPHMILQLRTQKNNMGINNRSLKINLYFRWYKDEKDGKQKMRAEFDWDRCTMDLLTGDALPNKAKLKELACFAAGDKAGYYNCQALGAKNINAQEMCQALYANPAIYEPLQDLLSIDRFVEFDSAALSKSKTKPPKVKKPKKEGVHSDGDAERGDGEAAPQQEAEAGAGQGLEPST